MHAVTLMIKSYFDKNDWNYNLEEIAEDNIDLISTGFTLKNEKVRVRIIVYRNEEMYHLQASSETKAPMPLFNDCLYAVNEFNSRSRAVGGYIDKDGEIVFFKGTNTDALAFSEEAFGADLNIIMSVVDNETAQIIKKAVTHSYQPDPEPDPETAPKPGFFKRLFSRN